MPSANQNLSKTGDFKPLISIIILNYNAGELLIKCVNSIQKSSYSNYEIILVDNRSKDNSHRICKEKPCNSNLFLEDDVVPFTAFSIFRNIKFMVS